MHHCKLAPEQQDLQEALLFLKLINLILNSGTPQSAVHSISGYQIRLDDKMPYYKTYLSLN